MAAGAQAAAGHEAAIGGWPALLLEPVATAASDARRYVREIVLQFGLERLVDTVTLAVSELVTNAALHARTGVAVTVTALPSGGIRLEVADGSPVIPRPSGFTSASSVGRGLRLLEALGRWGVLELADRGCGKIIWFEPAAEPGDDPPSASSPGGWARPGEPTGDDAAATAAGFVDAKADEKAVLGRYDTARGGELIAVYLRRFPLQVFAAAREHHDEMIREFTLLALAPASAHPVPDRLAALIDLLGRRHRAVDERTDAVRDQAAARGELIMDLTYRVPASARDSLIDLDRLMDEADGFCRSEQLLTLAAPPLERDFRRWFTSQFV